MIYTRSVNKYFNMNTSLTDALRWRYATNQFDPTKKISETDLDTILESGNLMPTAYGLQPFQFVVVTDQVVKDSLVAHSYGQKHVAENSHLIVIAARTDINEAMINEYMQRIETVRGLPAGTTNGFKEMMAGDLMSRSVEARLLWAQKQTYLALGGMLATASTLGIDNHALEGFSAAGYDEILGLTPQNLTATVLLAVGYRAEDDASQHYAKVRRPIEEIVIKQ
jgi:nitroreductase